MTQAKAKYMVTSGFLGAGKTTSILTTQIVSDCICYQHENLVDKLRVRTFFMETFGMMEEGKGNGGRASRYA